MNENILTDITRNLLDAWYLDLKFLVELLDEHNIDFDEIMGSIECNFWKDYKIAINTIIYEVLYTIASKFIAENSSLFKEYDDEFEIYTNYMDSHIYFTSEKVQSKFEKFY
jgi:hypothetical protein